MGTVYNTNIVTDGLIGCWDAANKRSYPGAGTTWTDLAGSNSATLVNDATFADVSLGAIAFDGTNDSVTVPIIDGQNGFSFSIWLYFLAVPTDNYTTFSIYNGGGAEFMFYIMETSAHTTSYMLGIRGAGTGNTLTSTNKAYQPSSNLGKWVHYCATYNGGGATTVGNYKVYFNGQVTDINLVENFGGAGNQDPMKWGQDAAGAGDLNGYMGHIAFYNRPLSVDEVKQNYEATKPRFTPRITKSNLELNLDAGDPASYVGGTTWKDTANGYNATLVNTIYSSEGGGSMDLDGTDDSVTISSNAAGDFSMKGWSILTYEFWIKRTDTTGWGRLLYESTQNLGGFLVGPALSGSNYYAYIDTDDGSSMGYVGGWGSTTDWIHLVTTYDGSNVVTYRNGVQVGTQSLTGDIKNTSGSYGGVVFGRTNHGGSDWFDGRVATIRVYQAALSAAEIMDNYQKTKARFGH